VRAPRASARRSNRMSTTKPKSKWTIITLGIIVSGLFAWVFFDQTTENNSASAVSTTSVALTTTTTNPSSDVCHRFRDAINDSADGILSWPELQSEMKTIYADTSTADYAVHSAARETLIALSQYDTKGFISAGKRLGEACAAADVSMIRGQV
jgi:hypothetical protein